MRRFRRRELGSLLSKEECQRTMPRVCRVSDFEPPYMTSTTKALGPIALLCLTLLLGCGPELDPSEAQSGGPEESRTRDLLLRKPELLLEVPGILRPDAKVGWRGYKPFGWHAATVRISDYPPAVHSMVSEASLTACATTPEDREVSFEAWLPMGVEHAEAKVLLNGVLLGIAALGPKPVTFTMESPKEAWKIGENEFSFIVEESAMEPGGDGIKHGLALSELRYGSPQRIEKLEHGFRLLPGTGLRYLLEERAASQVTISGVAERSGTLSVLTRFLAQSTMSPVQGRPTHTTFKENVESGSQQVELTLPSANGAMLEVEIFWSSPEGGRFELAGLELAEATQERAPSIVLISIDTLAARHTSLYGYGRSTSPRLSEFAKGATVFENCLSNAPWTMPSYAALMSGYFPSSARFSPNISNLHFAFDFPDATWTLADALSAAGYRTGAFVDSKNVSSRLGFSQGFELFDESALEHKHGAPLGGLEASSAAAFQWLDGLEEDDSFFLFIHANDVHGPYLPKGEALGAFRSDEWAAPGPEVQTGALTGTYGQVPDYLLPSALGDYDQSSETLPATPFRTAYDESILSMDEVLGGVLEELKARGILDEAIVIFSADHGEAFNEHELFGHGQLYQDVLQVPLVISLPATLRSKATPAHVSQAVQLVDLYPTLIELAGLTTRRDDFHGRSLTSILSGQGAELAPTYSEGGIMRQSAVVFGEWKLIEKWPNQDSMVWTMLTNPTLEQEWRTENVPEVGAGKMDANRLLSIATRVGSGESLYSELNARLAGPTYELYHLGSDPNELVNLSAERPEVFAELREYMQKAQADAEELQGRVRSSQVFFSQEELVDLKALGY